MEPWQGGGAPWCIGSVFPAPQLLTGAAAIPCEPKMRPVSFEFCVGG